MNDSNNNLRAIKVAVLAEEPFFWGSKKYYHKIILDGYSWKIDNKMYVFSVAYIYDKDIIKGKLTLDNFDVLVIPGGGIGNNEALVKGFNFLPSVKKFKHNIAEFVKQGGGLIGICGGAALITDLMVGDGKKPTTIIERLYNKSSLNISCVSSYFRTLAFPLLYPFQYQYPESIGNSAYAFSFAPGQTEDGKYIMTTGCPLDLQIDRDNPIFFNYASDTRRIRWWAGQSLYVPEDPDREICVLARYPKKDLSEFDSLKVFAWRYTGGFYGFIRAVLKAFKMSKINDLGLEYVPLFSYYLAGDWEPTDIIMELDMANRPCMTAEIYPNEHGGRIVLSTVHSEYLIWWGGYIEKYKHNNMNCIGNGLHQWKNINSLSDSLQNELTHNWWILRRMVAWIAKVPDCDLPPMELGVINETIKERLIKNIFWDGTLLHQLKNI
jgi:glutamine amidotransferase-like uncharacterized protein